MIPSATTRVSVYERDVEPYTPGTGLNREEHSMDTTKFEELVEARAVERVQTMINKCKGEVRAALRPLIEMHHSAASNSYSEEACEILAILASENHKEGWPSRLWRRERQRVRKELFETMDEMQRTLLSLDKRDKSSDATPATEKDEE